MAASNTYRQLLTPGLPVLLTGLSLAGFAAISVISVMSSAGATWALFLPLLLIGMIFVGWIIGRAIAGSPHAIIAYLVLVLFITDGAFRVRGAGEISTDWQSALKFALWTGAGVIGVAHMPRISTLLGRTGPACWLAYIVMAMISAIYSPTPAYSFGGAFSLLCLFAFAFTVTTKLTESQFLWTMTLTLAVFLLVGWVVRYVNPALGTSEFQLNGIIVARMAGIAGQADNLGAVCSKYLGAVFLLWMSGRCRLIFALPLAAIGAATVFAADAHTAMVATAAAVIGTVVARSALGLLTAALTTALGIMLYYIGTVNLNTIGSAVSRSGDAQEALTLTGRVDIWDFVWQNIVERPLFGWGYNASKIIMGHHLGFRDGLKIDTAHNLLLQSLLSVGFVGTAPIIILLFSLIFSLILRPNRFRDLFLIIILVDGLTDTGALGTTPTVLTLLFFMISVLPRAPLRSLSPVAVGALPATGPLLQQRRPVSM